MLSKWKYLGTMELHAQKICTPCGACGVTPYEREQLRVKYKSRFNPCRVCSEEGSQVHDVSTASSGNRSGAIDHRREMSDINDSGVHEEAIQNP